MTALIESGVIAGKLEHNVLHAKTAVANAKSGFDKCMASGDYRTALSYLQNSLEALRVFHATKSVWSYCAARREFEYIPETDVARMITINAESHAVFMNSLITIMLRNYATRTNSINTARIYTQGGVLQYLSHIKNSEFTPTSEAFKVLKRYIDVVNKKLIFGQLIFSSRFFIETNANVMSVGYQSHQPDHAHDAMKALVKAKMDEVIARVTGEADVSTNNINLNYNGYYYANDLVMNEMLLVFNALKNVGRYTYEHTVPRG